MDVYYFCTISENRFNAMDGVLVLFFDTNSNIFTTDTSRKFFFT